MKKLVARGETDEEIATALETIARLIREGYISGEACSVKWWLEDEESKPFADNLSD